MGRSAVRASGDWVRRELWRIPWFKTDVEAAGFGRGEEEAGGGVGSRRLPGGCGGGGRDREVQREPAPQPTRNSAIRVTKTFIGVLLISVLSAAVRLRIHIPGERDWSWYAGCFHTPH